MPEIIYDESIFNVLPYRFLDYSVAVLKDRAIPDGFDGLKPIHRRVLMAMHDLGLTSRTPHRKSAKTIGEVLGKYHPHGDQSAYEALVGLAQTFNMRYPLVDGSGNFGSLNGDPAAAMRYTESRLSPFGELMLEGVEKLSPTKDNFDNSAQEPITLSSYFPNLLLNPTNGIAVGLATKFAPHYARDVYDALIAAVQSEARGEKIDQEELIDIIKAPDFPTGAEIVNGEEVKNIYRTGKGPVTLRAKYRLEKNNIVYYEIPYKVTPKSILEKIASLNLADIKDVRDESSLKNGLRLVVELKKDTAPEYIVNKLFKETDLQCNYNVNMVAIMDNRPADKLSLGKLVDYYLTHLQEVHRRSLTIQKQELEGKLFVINTLLKAIDCIDAIIRIVRYDDDPVQSMQDKLGFTQEEAEYIFNIRLSSLSKANKLELDAKKALYTAELARLAELLENRLPFLADLVAKLESVRDSKIFKDDKRHTDILNVALQADVDPKQYVKQEDVIVSYSTLGFLRSNKPEEFKVTSRKTLGTTLKLREDEHLLQTLSLSTHDDLLLFSDLGKAYILPVYKIPIGSRKTGAKSVNNYLNLEDEEHIIMISYIPVNSEDLSVVFVTAQGWVKRTNIELLTKVRSSLGGSRAIGLEEGDRIAGGVICHHNADICIFTSNGRGLKFNIDDPERTVRPSGKTARGVLALRLQDGERVVAATTLKENSSVLIITSNGFGKRLSRKHIKDQKRAQVPIQYLAKTKEVGEIVSVIEVQGTDDIIITTRQGQLVRVSVDDFKAVGKTARGLMMIKFKAEGDAVVSMSSVLQEEDTASEEPEAEQQALF